MIWTGKDTRSLFRKFPIHHATLYIFVCMLSISIVLFWFLGVLI